MGKKLSVAQIRNYWRDGFLAPIDVMSEAEALALRLRIESVEAEQGPLHYLRSPHLFTTVADEMVHMTPVLDAIEDIIGPDILLWSSIFVIKEPGDRKFVSWHQDLTYWGLEPAEVASVWLALSPATRESGGMRMIPGSHRRGQVDHTTSEDDENVLLYGQHASVEIDESHAVDIVLRPGQMSLHHGLVLHASYPNVSSDRRIGYNMNTMPPHVRQVKAPEDSAMLLRGADSFGHFRLERRPSADFSETDIAYRENLDRARRQFDGGDGRKGGDTPDKAVAKSQVN